MCVMVIMYFSLTIIYWNPFMMKSIKQFLFCFSFKIDKYLWKRTTKKKYKN